MLLAVEEASSTSHSSFVAREEHRSLAESSRSESVRAADGGRQIMRARSWYRLRSPLFNLFHASPGDRFLKMPSFNS